MRAKNLLVFIVSTGIAFVVFAGIAMGLEVTGLVSVTASNNVQYSVTPLAELDTREQAWRALGIDDYQITVRFTGAWESFAATITVQDGINGECTVEQPHILANGLHVNDECDLMTDLSDQVTGLFAIVRSLPVIAQNIQAEVTPEVDFDATYYFPTRIVFAPTNIDDAWYIYEVIGFEPLP
jgi:hypothetical protein